MEDALGRRGRQVLFVRGTGMSQSNVTRYLNGTYIIPKHGAVLVEMIQTLRLHGLPLPDSFSEDHVPPFEELDEAA